MSALDWFKRIQGQKTEAEAQPPIGNAAELAGRIVETAQAGKKDVAMRLLQYGDYVRASEQVERLLAKLYVRLNASA